jgi:hypothetical protein
MCDSMEDEEWGSVSSAVCEARQRSMRDEFGCAVEGNRVNVAVVGWRS